MRLYCEYLPSTCKVSEDVRLKEFLMSLINKEVADFTTMAYQNDDFHEVKKADLLGKWSVFFFYPADFTFVCPTELKDLADKYGPSKATTRCLNSSMSGLVKCSMSLLTFERPSNRRHCTTKATA